MMEGLQELLTLLSAAISAADGAGESLIAAQLEIPLESVLRGIDALMAPDLSRAK